jgi:hypothetical protein
MLKNLEVLVVRLANGRIDQDATVNALAEKLAEWDTVEQETERGINSFLSANPTFKSGNLDGVAAGVVDTIESTTGEKIPFTSKHKVAQQIKEYIRADKERFYCRQGKGRSRMGGVSVLDRLNASELAAVEADKQRAAELKAKREAEGLGDE